MIQVLNDIANASHHLGNAVADLEQIWASPATPSGERDRIRLVIPRLNLRRRELDAEFDALVARMETMPAPSADMVQIIHQATDVLAKKVTTAKLAGLALSTATSIVNAARTLIEAHALNTRFLELNARFADLAVQFAALRADDDDGGAPENDGSAPEAAAPTGDESGLPHTLA